MHLYPDFISSGETGIIRLKKFMLKFKKTYIPILGRLIIREQGKTITVGKILKVNCGKLKDVSASKA